MAASSSAPGWYPDETGKMWYWDGKRLRDDRKPPRPAAVPVKPAQSSLSPSKIGSADTSDNSKATAVAIGVGVLVVIGFVMSMQSVTLLTGSGQVWTGVAVVAAGTALAFFMRAAAWVRIVAVLLLVAALGNALYIENQLSNKRNELTQIFDS